MNLKKLTQAVFEGLPKEYRFAIVGKGGVAAAHTKDPFALVDENRWNTAQGSLSMLIGYGFDDSDWQNSKIERQDVPAAADIDWIEGAAYFCKPFPPIQPSGFFINSDFTQVHDGVSWVQALPQVKDLQSGVHSLNVIKRESIADVARSIEAARVAEKSMPYPDGDPRYFETSDCLAVKISDDQPAAQVIDPPVLGNQGGRAYPHYFKDVSAVDAIDLYHVARLYDITDPALFHAFKKIACAGKRGAKDRAQDVKEAIDALKRWQELNV